MFVSNRAALAVLGCCLPALALGVACTGHVQGPENGVNAAGSSGSTGAAGGSGAAPDCALGASPGSAPLRRLSNAEYRNTLEDLFSGVSGIDSLVASATSELPAEPESLGFHNNAQFLSVQPLLAQKYMDAAEALAASAAQSPGLVPCTPVAGQEMSCGSIFIQSFLKRAYRRPPSAEETARYAAQFQSALTDYGFSTAVEWTIFSVLQSPSFLYRVELGRASSTAVTRPTAYETASRLSYLFWQSAPDADLIGAAESGKLESAVQIEAQARRMLADPRSARLFQYFTEWLGLDRLDDVSRDPQVFPDLPPDLPGLYRAETQAFVQSLLGSPGGDFKALMTAPYTYLNQPLAALYGLSGPSGADFVRVDDAHRSGVLTQALLMAQDKPYRTSIVRRGLKVLTSLLCETVPAPPNNVALNLDSIDPTLSQSERLAQHRQNATCAVCHSRLDPMGLLFENFDAVGRYRTSDEAGRPIVTQSELTGTRDLNGPVADARALGALLAESQEARDCYVTQTFRFFFGRDVEPADACSIAELKAAFSANELSLSELLIALTQSDAFLYRPTSEVSL